MDFFKLYPLLFSHQPLPSQCSQMVVHRPFTSESGAGGWAWRVVSRDNVFEIQVSHLRPFKSVSEKRVLESEFCQVPQMALTCMCYSLRITYFGNCTPIILFWLFPRVYVGVKGTLGMHPGYVNYKLLSSLWAHELAF